MNGQASPRLYMCRNLLQLIFSVAGQLLLLFSHLQVMQSPCILKTSRAPATPSLLHPLHIPFSLIRMLMWK